jgi:hypothetical protein
MSNKGSSVKTLGGKKVIHSQAREIVYSVYVHMQKEKEYGKPINLNQVQERVSSATDVSCASLQRIFKEGNLMKVREHPLRHQRNYVRKSKL